jgi:hypothetical protein
MNKDVKRIAWYTRKVAEFSRTHWQANRNQYRSQRLLAYKFALNERLKEARK